MITTHHHPVFLSHDHSNQVFPPFLSMNKTQPDHKPLKRGRVIEEGMMRRRRRRKKH